MERVALDVVGCRAEVKRPSLEEHHGHVHAPLARGDRPLAEPVEGRLVELGEVEPGLPVFAAPGPVRAHGCGVMQRWKSPPPPAT
jgi:hypothetical protein